MALNKKPYKGTRDFFPADKRVQDYIFNKMRSSAEAFAFEGYEGPMLEEVALYKAKSGEELINEQIYSFEDRGNRFVAIRPEMTPTVARMVAQVHREIPKPIKWYSIPNLMRYEKPQRGRLREHWQFNCDIFGEVGRSSEIEILQLITHLFNSFGANSEHFEILINDREIVNIVFNDLMKIDEETSYKLYKIVDKAKKVKPEGLEKMISELNLSSEAEAIFKKYLSLQNFEELFSFLEEKGYGEKSNGFKELFQITSEIGLKDYLVYDPTIVRGLDYYTGIVFEVFDKNPENRRALCGGGAYANLLQIFNENPVPGVGFGLGDVTLTDFLITHKLMPDLSKNEVDLYLTFQSDRAVAKNFELANKVREMGFKSLNSLETIKFKKVFSNADKFGARFVSILGDKELDEGFFQVKNLATKESFDIKFSELDKLRELLNA
ncbi:histidine--tRNA ligase [Halobacteriovorax marinus]|uniref:Histidine--tRNA ligase n=1 Tax=Halobacteriovorax marinus (strain ATCC BAA-682 / DSM 15412 / SJ) TaxID=862908 RepID=E1X420_HALMS|nr:histidine--tRNA ligase [Halobacteriovorax marinus]ATH06793.1 histidine--tRNA ligase [Halobacteriovorax marinus]CBW25360.1 histidyl-tRNA synthetase [Halobacteriovorax marinus SJ]